MTVIEKDDAVFRGGERAIVASLVVAALGLVGFIVGLVLEPTQALASYLIAWFYAVTVVLGLLAFVLGARAMNARWPAALRRLVEAGLSSMLLLALMYLPLFWSADRLYPWAHPERVADHAAREIVLHKRAVMNTPFFYVRAVLFILFWTAVAELLRNSSLRGDRPGAPDRRDFLRGFSSVVLPLVGFTGTFAAFDWLMSLSPDFYSTMYGLYVLSGGFVAAVGLLALMMWTAQRAGFIANVNRSHWYAVGRLLFAFLIFWAYTGFFQYLLIWIANKPVEAKFYIERFAPGDMWTSWFLVFGHFVFPWLALMSYSVKRRAATVTLFGVWILACHYVDIHWLVGARRGAALPWRWEDLPALMLVGGLATAFALWRQRGHRLAAYYDPDFAAAAAYESR